MDSFTSLGGLNGRADGVRMTAKELALMLQRERSSHVVEAGSNPAPETESAPEFVTMSSYKRVSVRRTFNDSGFMSCTVSSGQVLPLKKRVREDGASRDLDVSQLLPIPMKDLLVSAEELKLSNTLTGIADFSLEAKELWVDKYSPKSFPHLLSNEKVNREVLKALKQWDRFVFKSNDVTADSEAADTRPEQKVILLCGPPGTGKTTLAHIAAAHCGYRVMEVNASDERTSDALYDVFLRATQNRTLDADKRPNCIVLDEADGIDGKDTLRFLINIIKCPLKTGTGSDKKRGAAFPLTRPLICVCNDQYAPALRELRTMAEVFVFQPPTEQRLVQRLRAVCQSEGLDIHNAAVLSGLCRTAGQDIRSALNNLQFAAMKSLRDGNSSDGGRDIGIALAAMIEQGLKDDDKDLLQVLKKVLSRGAPEAGKQVGSPLVGAMNAMTEFGDMRLILTGIFENLHLMPESVLAGTDSGLSRCQALLESLSLADEFSAFAFNHSDGFQVQGYVALAAATANSLSNSKPFRVAWPSVDRDMRYRKDQRANIVSTLQEYARTKCLASQVSTQSLQVLVVDVLSSLLDVVTPRLRPLPLCNMNATEQSILQDTGRTMELSGLSLKEVVVKPQFQKFGGDRFGEKFGDKSKTGPEAAAHTQANHFVKPYATTAWELQPALSELVTFAQPLDGQVRRPAYPADLCVLIDAEQRQFAIKLQVDKIKAADSSRIAQVAGKDKSVHGKAGEVPVAAPPVSKAAVPRAIAIPIAAGAEKKLKSSAVNSFFSSQKSTSAATKGSSTEGDEGANVGKKRKAAAVLFKYNQGFSNAVRRSVSIRDFI